MKTKYFSLLVALGFAAACVVSAQSPSPSESPPKRKSHKQTEAPPRSFAESERGSRSRSVRFAGQKVAQKEGGCCRSFSCGQRLTRSRSVCFAGQEVAQESRKNGSISSGVCRSDGQRCTNRSTVDRTRSEDQSKEGRDDHSRASCDGGTSFRLAGA